MAKSSKEALKIARQIFELEQKIEPLKAELSILQRQFDAILLSDDSEFPVPNRLPTNQINLTGKLKELFKESNGEVLTIQSILHKLPEIQASTLRSTMSRLLKDSFVEQVERGQYRLLNSKSSDLTTLL